MNVSELRGWLLQQPKPALLRLTIDGEVEELKPAKSWAKTAETIAALEPELLQALDAAGKVLRATKLEIDAEPAPRRRGSPGMPDVPAALAADPHVALLHHFATLLAHGYEHSTHVAFTKMVEVVEAQGARSEAIEQRLERAEARARRLQDDQVEDAYDRAEELAAQAAAGNGDEAFKTHLVNAFLAGQLQRGPANGAANGAGKANGAAAPSKAKS